MLKKYLMAVSKSGLKGAQPPFLEMNLGFLYSAVSFNKAELPLAPVIHIAKTEETFKSKILVYRVSHLPVYT